MQRDSLTLPLFINNNDDTQLRTEKSTRGCKFTKLQGKIINPLMYVYDINSFAKSEK